MASTSVSNSFNKGIHVACLLKGEAAHVGFAELRTSCEDAFAMTILGAQKS